jgi:hypothetical protein
MISIKSSNLESGSAGLFIPADHDNVRRSTAGLFKSLGSTRLAVAAN